MSTNGERQLDAVRSRERIMVMLEKMPAEEMAFIEHFIEFMSQQRTRHAHTIREEETAYLHPTVPVPASALLALSGIMPSVGGDALADTEAIYDDF